MDWFEMVAKVRLRNVVKTWVWSVGASTCGCRGPEVGSGFSGGAQSRRQRVSKWKTFQNCGFIDILYRAIVACTGGFDE